MPQSRGYTLGFRDIARPTDARTVIAPLSSHKSDVEHTLPVLFLSEVLNFDS